MDTALRKFKGNVEKWTGPASRLGPSPQKGAPRTPSRLSPTHFSTRSFNFRSFLILVIILGLSLAPATLQAKSKTYWKRGFWIGALSGSVVGGVTFLALSASDDCSKGDDFEGLCGPGGTALFGLGGALGGAVVGMGIGTIIGALIKREEPVVLAPVISVQEDKTYGGLSLTKSF